MEERFYDHTDKSEEHDKGDDWNDYKVCDWRYQRDLFEADHDDGKREYHRSKAHGEGFPKSEPARKPAKYPHEEIPEKDKPENGQEGEMEAHIMIEYQRIQHYK